MSGLSLSLTEQVETLEKLVLDRNFEIIKRMGDFIPHELSEGLATGFFALAELDMLEDSDELRLEILRDMYLLMQKHDSHGVLH